MKVRKTTPKDINELLEIFSRARKYMRENNNPHQWSDDYPSKEIIDKDISLNQSYVLVDENEEIVATMMYHIGIDETYNKIDGAWLNNDEYGVIHRIASKQNKRGSATELINWALKQCCNLRIDTHEENKPMIWLLNKHGFTQCGIIYLQNGDPRIAFHKTCEKSEEEF
ncbi:MAG TPA: GNAT family N-acetyltransferase [Erysipelothrix sp.]|jgi:predicted GNAT family N-acyltransferase|nr:GNAT family N-acetyltransferase [Erysipelothrix sp.]